MRSIKVNSIRRTYRINHPATTLVDSHTTGTTTSALWVTRTMATVVHNALWYKAFHK